MAAKKKSGLQKAQEELSGLPDTAVKKLTMPVTSVVAEAQRVARLYVKHGVALRAVNIDAKLAASISSRIAVLNEAQVGVLDRVRPVKSEAESKLTTEAETLRSDLMAMMEWAFRDGSQDEELARIRQGDGIDDLINDLEALVALATAQPKALKFEKGLKAKLARATTVAQTLTDLLDNRRTTETDTEATDLRNRAAAWLDVAVREVRAAGRFAFRNKPDLRALFSAPDRHVYPRTKVAPAPK